jgi:hypothetical protein
VIKSDKLILNQVGNFKLPQMGKITLPLTKSVGATRKPANKLRNKNN